MSHIQGSDYVGSMVVVEDGLAKKSEYRRFKIKTVAGNDDFAAMEEVLRRRFTNYVADRDRPPEEWGKFAYPPQLLLVDGGKGQLSVAVKVLKELGLDRRDPGCGAGEAVRRGLHSRPARVDLCCRARARRCTCCSASATRATGSRSPITGSCATNECENRCSTTCLG